MIEYKTESFTIEGFPSYEKTLGFLNEQGRSNWIICDSYQEDEDTAIFFFYREVPDPTPDGEAIGQMVQEDVDEESSQRAQVGQYRELYQSEVFAGDHGEPALTKEHWEASAPIDDVRTPVMPKTLIIQPLGRSDDEIQEMVQRIYSTPDPQETFYQMWSRMIAVPAQYLWPDDPKKS
jgi:hypothetical protein